MSVVGEFTGVIASISESTGLQVKSTGGDAWTNLGTTGSGIPILSLYSSSSTKVGGVSDTGQVLFQNSIDSTTAFQIQEEGDNPLFVADTTNMSINIQNGNDAQVASGGYLVLGSTSGENLAIDNNEIQARNNGANSTLTLNDQGGVVRIGSTNAAQLQVNNTHFTINTGGVATFRNGSNSTAAFQVQNAGGSAELFSVDTTNNRVYVGDTAADGTGTLLVLDTKNTSGDPTGVNGGMYYNSDAGKFRCYQNSGWTDCIGAGGSTTLQDAYDNSSSPATILTADAKDILFSMANTTTDANFRINIATSSTGELQVESNGTDVLQIGAAGQLQLDVQGATGGILLGGDANLYRYSADILGTNSSFLLNNEALLGVGSSSSDGFLYSWANGDAADRFAVSVGGLLQWGDGTNTLDTNLYRESANTLVTDSNFAVYEDIFAHDDLNVTDELRLGASQDVILYRSDADELSLGDGDALMLDNGNGDSFRIHGDDPNGIWIEVDNPSTNAWLLRSYGDGSSYSINTDGAMGWDDGSDEVDLYHDGGGTLRIDSDGSNPLYLNAASNTFNQNYIQFSLDDDEKWELGSEGDDFYLYNDSASDMAFIIDGSTNEAWFEGVIYVDDNIYSSGKINANDGGPGEVEIGDVGPSSVAAILFEQDSSIYRSAANVLQTNSLFVLDNEASDPSGVNGGIFYNTTSNKFRCYQNSAWVDCIGAGGGSSMWQQDGTSSNLLEPASGSHTGIMFGNDTSIYRAGSDELQIDNKLTIENSGSILELRDPAGTAFEVSSSGRVDIYTAGLGLAISNYNDAGDATYIQFQGLESPLWTVGANEGSDTGDFFIYDEVVDEVALRITNGGAVVGYRYYADDYITANDDDASEVIIGERGPSGQAAIEFGGDAMIYLSASNTLRTNGDSLYVQRNGAEPLTVDRGSSDGTVVSIRQAGTQEGTISVSGTTVSYNAFTGSHYARTTESIDKGMLVSLTGENSRLGDREESEVIYGVKKTAQANDPSVLGSYLAVLEPEKEDGSPNPESNTNPSLINAVGNSEIWVVDNGQDINPGDGLMSSDTAGYAMKDPGTYETSHIVAKSATKVDWSNVTETIDGKKVKKISVLYGAYEGSGSATTSAPGSSTSGSMNVVTIVAIALATVVSVQLVLAGAKLLLRKKLPI